jgi:hypothetical protein
MNDIGREMIIRMLEVTTIFGLGLISSFVFWLWRRWKLRGASNWPVAEGRIESRSIARDDSGATFACRVGYSYTVAGEYYAGYAEKTFTSENLATAFRNQVQDRQRVSIRYKPSKPETSALDLQTIELHRAAVVQGQDTSVNAPFVSQEQPTGSSTFADVSSEAQAMDEMSTLSILSVNSASNHSPGNDRPSICCPLCGWVPTKGFLWTCSCGHQWDTFETGGVCPACAKRWNTTDCYRCHHSSPHADWYQSTMEGSSKARFSPSIRAGRR